ncbi:MAG: 5'-nucleotidase C-terminal domain-containing protein [Fusobacterium sp.]|nr:5'-nucleotidase C-terminal domain-containing protein [Fusobacterium sp.]
MIHPINSLNFGRQPQQSQQKRTNASIFYVNDLHGNMANMSRIYNAKQSFDKQNHDGQDVLALGSGDISAGANIKLLKISNAFLNVMGVLGTAIGNHEFDAEPEQIAEINKGANYKIMGANLNIEGEDNPLQGKITKSFVQEINGNKYGIIGLIPPDLHERIRENGSRKTIMPYSKEDSIKAVQDEANKMKEDGINKIIVLSHCGLEFDKSLAKNTDGVDVILGAHTHELIKDIKNNENLFTSKTGEPVIITQAGKDGEQFGILNLEFDENGIIQKAQNNVQKSNQFKRNPILERIFDGIIGKATEVGYVEKTAPAPEHRLVDPNPHAFLIMDACREEFDTDLALINAGNIRGHFDEGKLTERKVFEVVPLKNRMVKMKLTEEEVVNALKNGAKSLINPGFKPSIVMPSGLEYTMNRKGEVLDATFIDKQGNKHAIDINNPDKNKVYTVATDDFFASGGDKLIPNKIDEVDEKFDFDKDKLTCDYIKKHNKPVRIEDDGRIQIVD